MFLLLLLTELLISASPVAAFQEGNGFVTFYRKCQYTGSNFSLAAGRYTAADVQAISSAAWWGYDDVISSVRQSATGPRLLVQLYEGDNFRGASHWFTADQACLTPLGWTDRVSSIIIENRPGQDSAQPPETGGDPSTVNVKTPTATASPAPVPSPMIVGAVAGGAGVAGVVLLMAATAFAMMWWHRARRQRTVDCALHQDDKPLEAVHSEDLSADEDAVHVTITPLCEPAPQRPPAPAAARSADELW